MADVDRQSRDVRRLPDERARVDVLANDRMAQLERLLLRLDREPIAVAGNARIGRREVDALRGLAAGTLAAAERTPSSVASRSSRCPTNDRRPASHSRRSWHETRRAGFA